VKNVSKVLILHAFLVFEQTLIIGTNGKNLEDIMRDFKSHTSRALKKSIKIIYKKAERIGCYG
jgi:hypothetical protein